MMGIYAGFSVITYVQILAYGFYIVWSALRKRYKTRKIRKEIGVSAVVVPSIQASCLARLNQEKVSETKLKHQATSLSDTSNFSGTIGRICNLENKIDAELCLPGSINNWFNCRMYLFLRAIAFLSATLFYI